MAFDREAWKEKLDKAQTAEEITAVIMELPERSLDEMSEEDREFVLMEEKIEAELLALAAKKKVG